MRLAHYLRNGEVRVVMVKGETVFDIFDNSEKLDLSRLMGAKTIDDILMKDLLDAVKNIELEIIAHAKNFPLSEVKLLSPILRPEKILMVAVNYKSHAKEQNITPPEGPYFFAKFRNSLIGHEDPILLPRVSNKVDWEAELVIAIGKTGKYIPREEALSYVAGYTICCDITFRDLQNPQRWGGKPNPLGRDWVRGKALDSSLPMGPWLVTKEEVPDPQNCAISLRVNGELRQESNTADMIFKVEELIESASAGLTLEPGDLISTGTPSGVAAYSGFSFLKNGDLVETSIGGIGTLRNPVVAE